ncbi:MAG TPA: hypothetical protein VG322_16880 [Candidatus Acidoferrales bacterium]|jgi:hypothetical protein|nr:hypothetical protein [Candidatus Acidoferrales bacterium]
MSNQSYLSVWCKNFSEERILEDFEKFLGTVPFSATKPGFTYLIVRAIDSSESPLLEQDLRSVPLDAAGIIELAKDYLHSDVSYEVESSWDLWVLDAQGKWKSEPQSLQLLCHGEDYDDGFWRENGHLQANLGFEHLFTGHANLLGMRKGQRAPAQSIEEARFIETMAWPENLQRYQEKTRENIKKLLDWARKIEKAVPVDRLKLWSEGEENFEARMEEILVAH